MSSFTTRETLSSILNARLKKASQTRDDCWDCGALIAEKTTQPPRCSTCMHELGGG